jgi:pilus assembly protein CpaB
MNKRFAGVLMFAFVVAAAGGLITYRSLIDRPQQPAAKAAAPTVQIVLAAKDLEVGSMLKEGDIQMGDWTGQVPVGAATKVQDLMGRGVTTPIYAKEPIIESRLAPKGAGAGLAAMIPRGMRAFAVSVNEIVGVAGFVTAGSHVDLLIAGNSPGGNGALGTLSKTLIQNLEVLSAGQDFKKDPEGKPMPVQVVNVLVTPEQAEVLSLASSQTSIRMTLRNPLDHEIAKTPGTAMKFVWQGGGNLKSPGVADDTAPAPKPRTVAPKEPKPVVAQLPPIPPKPAPFVMEIFQGGTRSETKFDRPAVESKSAAESKGEGK